MKSLIIMGVAVCITVSMAWAPSNPKFLCGKQYCKETEVCRSVNSCIENICSLQKICVDAQSSYLDDCDCKDPSLASDERGRCCPPNSAITAGVCPQPSSEVEITCLNQCMSDAECSGRMKCCQISENCKHKKCVFPDYNELHRM